MNTTATNEIERACELRRRDLLAHRWADYAVAAAMEEMRREQRGDPEARPLRFAHDVATLATTMLIDKLLNEDQAIATLRAERDHYKALAEQTITLMPPRLTIPIITREGEQG
jgi:hypothetical protein